jgi:hypothetical protein
MMARMTVRKFLAVAAMLLTFADAGAAFAMPIAPIADSSALSATLVRGGRGGGGRGMARGGAYRGGRGGAVAVRGGAVRGRGGAVAVRGGAVRGGAYRGGAVVRGGGYRRGGAVVWGRPGYRWAPGGAIAAGAAIGFITAAGAAAYYTSQPPAPGLCWYYTDPSRRAGFWDNCP